MGYWEEGAEGGEGCEEGGEEEGEGGGEGGKGVVRMGCGWGGFVYVRGRG